MPMYKQWVLSKDAPILNSKPKTSQKLCEKDFELVEEQLRELCKGEILCRALFLSIDPITRLYISYGLGKSILLVLADKKILHIGLYWYTVPYETSMK